jgi:hypothetical protein
MALPIAAPTMPSTILISKPVSLFMNCSANQPGIPPMIMAAAAIQPIAGSQPDLKFSNVRGPITKAVYEDICCYSRSRAGPAANTA